MNTVPMSEYLAALATIEQLRKRRDDLLASNNEFEQRYRDAKAEAATRAAAGDARAARPVGTRVRILMGRCKRIGTVQGWRYAKSALTLQRRVVVQLTDGQVKSYLPRKVKALQEPPCAP